MTIWHFYCLFYTIAKNDSIQKFQHSISLGDTTDLKFAEAPSSSSKRYFFNFKYIKNFTNIKNCVIVFAFLYVLVVLHYLLPTYTVNRLSATNDYDRILENGRLELTQFSVPTTSGTVSKIWNDAKRMPNVWRVEVDL